MNRAAVLITLATLALAGAGAGLVFSGAGARVVSPEPPADPVTPVDGAFVSQFYQAKDALGRKSSGHWPKATEVGDDWVVSFRDGYLHDPDVELRSLRLTPLLRSKVVTGSVTEYCVAVSIQATLYNKAERKEFDGGETVDHRLTVRADPTPRQVLADLPLGEEHC